MRSMTRNFAIGIWVVAVALVGCTPKQDGGNAAEGGGSGGNSQTGGSATPEQSFAAFKAAASKNDVNEFMNCLTPAAQNEFAFGTVMMSAFLPMKYMNDEAKATALGNEITAVMEKHGLSEDTMEAMDPSVEPDFEKMLAPVKDKAAFVGEMFTIMIREDPDTPLKAISTATLKDVKIDGDKASGTITVDGEDQPLEFAKIDGKWLIKLPGPGGPAPTGE